MELQKKKISQYMRELKRLGVDVTEAQVEQIVALVAAKESFKDSLMFGVFESSLMVRKDCEDIIKALVTAYRDGDKEFREILVKIIMSTAMNFISENENPEAEALSFLMQTLHVIKGDEEGENDEEDEEIFSPSKKILN